MEGAGSAIIVLRHLRRLKTAGWEIQVVGDWGQDETACREEGWEVRYLPHRRPWWPPYFAQSDVSAAVRHWLWAGEARALFPGATPDAVLTYLSAFSDALSQVAAAYARRFALPLSTLVHDDCRVFADSAALADHQWKRYRWVMKPAKQNWFVSPELASAYGFPDPTEGNTLHPLGEGLNLTPPDGPPSGVPLFVYAGNARAPQIPVLERMSVILSEQGARLLVLADRTPDLESALQRSPLEWRAPFLNNREALVWLQQNASAIVVAYATKSDDQPWVRSSFPSKFVEFVHLGIPVLLAVPMDSAIAHWARKHEWADIIAPDDIEGLRHYVVAIEDPVQWKQKGLQALKVAAQHFDASHLQSRFARALMPDARDTTSLSCSSPVSPHNLSRNPPF